MKDESAETKRSRAVAARQAEAAAEESPSDGPASLSAADASDDTALWKLRFGTEPPRARRKEVATVPRFRAAPRARADEGSGEAIAERKAAPSSPPSLPPASMPTAHKGVAGRYSFVALRSVKRR